TGINISIMTATLDHGTLRIEGTPGPDTITARQVNNMISIDGITGGIMPSIFDASQVQKIEVNGRGGDDTISLNSESVAGQQALTVPCVVHGGDGNDVIIGGTKDDALFGDAGNDRIQGMNGNDYVDGGTGNDTLFGVAGKDTLYGDAGDDWLYGQDGADRL